MKVLDLFSGIGGFSLGLERAGMETVAFCEFDEHARKVLKKHWPHVPIHNDVRTLDGKKYRGTVDVVCGGFPCQDLSTAGKQAGFDGERSSLYREMLRIISECMPRYAIFENVTGLLTGESGRWFGQFLYDLASIGYDAEWHCVSASELGAHHHRDRVWIIAYPNNDGQAATKEREGTEERGDSNKTRQKPAKQSERCGSSSVNELLADSDSNRLQGQRQDRGVARQVGLCGRAWWDEIKAISAAGAGWEVEPELGRVVNGVPNRSHRLKQLGNAVVPQIPEAIGRAIMDCEKSLLIKTG